MTNFEKIKSMTIDEMTEELFYIIDCSGCPINKWRDHSCPNCDIIGCKSALKNWLESEVDDNICRT